MTASKAEIQRLARAKLDQRKLMLEQKEAAEQDLLSFVRMVWPILEPETPLQEGWVLDLLCDILTSITNGDLTRVCINVPPGSTKALDVNTPVLTTWGWKRHGDLAAGDFVFAPDGKPRRVLAVTEHRLEPAYTVSFDDGSALDAGAGHLWEVERDYSYDAPGGRRCRKTEVVTTPNLIPSVVGRALQRPDRIAVAEPVEFPPRRVLVDPYVLGAWLGDGSSASAYLNVGHEDIEHFQQFGRIAMTFPPDERRKQPFYRVALEGVQERLRILGILGNKHIPDDYLEASIGQRWELLRGLMDTDGCATSQGNCKYVTKLEEMGRQVFRLVCSLGIKAHLRQSWSYLDGVRHGPYQEVSFTPPSGARVFGLERKQAKLKGGFSRTRNRYVASVTAIGQRVVNCICVEGDLYLAGETLVTTHNSTLLNIFWPAWEWGPCNRPSLRYLSVSYSTAVPVRDNLRFARLIKHPVYQACWGDRVKIDRDGAEWVSNDRTGFKMVTSTGGGTTGFRGDRLLLDDLNNPKDVESAIVRLSTEKFVREIMPDRLNDLSRSAIVNLQQRTHQQDATGVLIKHGQNYEFFCVPMRFDPLRIGRGVMRRNEFGEAEDVWIDPRALGDDGKILPGIIPNARGEPEILFGSPMAKAEGESCWPTRFPEETLLSLELEKGPYAWSGQYQQIPGIRGGGVIRREWWRLWQDPHEPSLGTVVVSVDTSVEEGEANDYNACTAWGAFEGLSGEPQLLILSAWKKRCGLAELVRSVEETCRKHKADYLLIEHKTRGRDVHDEILRIYGSVSSTTWETVLVKVAGDKYSRLKAISELFSGPVKIDPERKMASFQGGMIYSPDKDWAAEVMDEVSDFPYGEHDDYVDSVSQAISWMRKHGVTLRRAEFDQIEEGRNRFVRRASVPYVIR